AMVAWSPHRRVSGAARRLDLWRTPPCVTGREPMVRPLAAALCRAAPGGMERHPADHDLTQLLHRREHWLRRRPWIQSPAMGASSGVRCRAARSDCGMAPKSEGVTQIVCQQLTLKSEGDMGK